MCCIEVCDSAGQVSQGRHSAFLSSPSRAAALRSLLLGKHRVGVEHGPVHADALHGRPVGGLYKYRAPCAAAHRTGHVLLEAHLAGNAMTACEARGGSEHRGGTAGKDLAAVELLRRQALQPRIGKLGHEALEAAVKSRAACEPACDAPVIHE